MGFSMKIAGIIALLLAIALGGWSITDYVQHEHDRPYAVQEMKHEVDRELDGRPPSNDADDSMKAIESGEQYDAIMGIVAVVALIGSIVLFSRKAKN